MTATEGCRVPGCSDPEWMMRQLCKPHFTILPQELQVEIRNAVKSAGFRRREWLKPLFDKALELIRIHTDAERVNAIIMLFRQRMAAIAGVVVSIRQLPIDDLYLQLATSQEATRINSPGDYAVKEADVARDLEILEVLSDTKIKLGDVIHRYAPAEEETGPELVTENSQADGAGIP